MNSAPGIQIGILANSVRANNIENNVNCTIQAAREPVTTIQLVELPTPRFSGRALILQQIAEQFNSCSSSTEWWDRIVVLTGTGGIGKSEIARKFAQIRAQLCPNVAWINAETETSLHSSFVSVGSALDLRTDPETLDPKELARRVYHHFSSHVKSGIFIFDGAVQMASTDGSVGIRDYLPVGMLENPPFVLVTSQTTYWGDKIKTISVPEMGEHSTCQLLRAHFTLDDETQLEKIQPDFIKLGKLLQGLPLALTLAASCIAYDAHNRPFDVVREKLQEYIKQVEHHNAILDQQFPPCSDTSYKHILSTVWRSTLDRLCQTPNGQEALELLRMSVYLPENRTPIHLLYLIYNNETVSDVLELCLARSQITTSATRDALELLQNFALVTVFTGFFGLGDAEMLRTHRLIQQFTRSYDRENQGARIDTILWYFIHNPHLFYPRIGSSLTAALKESGWPERHLQQYLLLACHLCELDNTEKAQDMLASAEPVLGNSDEASDLHYLSTLLVEIAQNRDGVDFNESICDTVEVACNNENSIYIQLAALAIVHMIVVNNRAKIINKETVSKVKQWLEIFVHLSGEADHIGLRHEKLQDILVMLNIETADGRIYRDRWMIKLLTGNKKDEIWSLENLFDLANFTMGVVSPFADFPGELSTTERAELWNLAYNLIQTDCAHVENMYWSELFIQLIKDAKTSEDIKTFHLLGLTSNICQQLERWSMKCADEDTESYLLDLISFTATSRNDGENGSLDAALVEALEKRTNAVLQDPSYSLTMCNVWIPWFAISLAGGCLDIIQTKFRKPKLSRFLKKLEQFTSPVEATEKNNRHYWTGRMDILVRFLSKLDPSPPELVIKLAIQVQEIMQTAYAAEIAKQVETLSESEDSDVDEAIASSGNIDLSSKTSLPQRKTVSDLQTTDAEELETSGYSSSQLSSDGPSTSSSTTLDMLNSSASASTRKAAVIDAMSNFAESHTEQLCTLATNCLEAVRTNPAAHPEWTEVNCEKLEEMTDKLRREQEELAQMFQTIKLFTEIPPEVKEILGDPFAGNVDEDENPALGGDLTTRAQDLSSFLAGIESMLKDPLGK